MNSTFLTFSHMNDPGKMLAEENQTACRASVNEAAVSAATFGHGTGVLHTRVAAAMAVARYHGVDPDPGAVRLDATEAAPSSPVLVKWLRDSGLWARGVRLTFRQLMKIESPAPILLVLSDGGAALVVGRNPEQGVLLVRDPRAPSSKPPVPLDELRLKQVWDGATVLVRPSRRRKRGRKAVRPRVAHSLGLGREINPA